MPFAVVGVGASAGGLQALERFLQAMPHDPGVAIVIVTHQSPGHVSLLPEILARSSKNPVLAIADGAAVQANHVYVAPPGKDVALLAGVLQTLPISAGHDRHKPIDSFLRSLADAQGDRAVGVILSGTGTDGTLGVRAIKGQAGLSFVQDDISAAYPDMPRSAASTGLADYVLPAERMPEKILACISGMRPRADTTSAANVDMMTALPKICVLIRSRTGHDFSGYKPTTLRRRIERRMRVHVLESPSLYVQFLQSNPHEVELLFKELLIGVTSFFRDPTAFAALERALARLLDQRKDDAPLRIWIPGCSTGEEAYSVAMLAADMTQRLRTGASIQIFGTDLDDEAIEVARAGVYPESVRADVGPERFARWFSCDSTTCHVVKEIRDSVVFAVQNIMKDPPFTRLDLICCRNLLIYLNPELQRQILPMFHYALNPGGLLFLGSSETPSFDELFAPVDRAAKIFEARPLPASAVPVLRVPAARAPMPLLPRPPRAAPTPHLATMVEKLLLDRFVPPTLITNERGDIIYIFGRTGAFLEPAAGEPQNNVFAMAREGLRFELMAAVRKAARHDQEVEHRVDWRGETAGKAQRLKLIARKLAEPEALRGLLRVTLEPFPGERELPSHGTPVAQEAASERAELEEELAHTRETLQGTIEELQSSNEELKSANEELQSMNEELQSSNEELATSKEELQSLNEELQTVNTELQIKIDELARVSDDMENLLNSTDVATLFLDRELRIQRYTRQVQDLVRIIATDRGRPVDDLVWHLRYDGLIRDARAVLETLVPRELEVETAQGAWRLLRIRPYRTGDDRIDGVVLTFLDIDRVKRAEVLAASRSLAQSVVETVREPLVVLDLELRVVSANRAFAHLCGESVQGVRGKLIAELAEAAFDSVALRELLGATVDKGTVFQDHTVVMSVGDDGPRTLRLNARRLEGEGAVTGHILVGIHGLS